ncbi:ferredoxin [Anaerosolibacter carboniphilus]|uniref:Ferredoxin n=1 Tax=Anaerosolibacter carboniphilus TaxID=1417629 RepID=A0A841KLK6_9FIRM|nr:(Fe-S)-binding protein [Anaerosolibacter carboniphilus]MBB6214327.1 ferredoxin [Anaerosolibacter carboniphilus]
MKDLIKNEMIRYVLESKENWLEEINDRYYDEPIIKFASADDPLFEEYKKIIGSDHLTPGEAFEMAFGKDSYHGGTVISVVLPINEKIRKSNAAQTEWASKEWALLRVFGDEVFKKGFIKYIENFLNQKGHRTLAPSDAEWFKLYSTSLGPASNWSERHIAYAAGLGTFGINDGFITEKGIAIRLVSFVTDLKLSVDIREAKNHTENCLLYSKGICGACMKRCPVGAISKDGHDKIKCYKYVYGEESRRLAESYGGSAKVASGCGLCQTKVPCECKNPIS